MEMTTLSQRPSAKSPTGTARSLAIFCCFLLLYAWLAGHIQFASHAPWLLLSTLGENTHQVPYYSLCMFKNILHLPCFFCGLTRSFVLIEQGDWPQALHYHLLGIPAFLFTVLLAMGGLLFPRATQAFLQRVTRRPAVLAGLAVLLVCWIWKLAHNPLYW